MKEKLISVTEVFNVHIQNHYEDYDGYEVKFSSKTYLMLIDNDQSCCEHWGYFASDDDFSAYIGKTLAAIELTDTALNKKALEENVEYGLDEGGIQFVDFKFSDGSVLQFAVYNSHNGSYGHRILIVENNSVFCDDVVKGEVK